MRSPPPAQRLTGCNPHSSAYRRLCGISGARFFTPGLRVPDRLFLEAAGPGELPGRRESEPRRPQ